MDRRGVLLQSAAALGATVLCVAAGAAGQSASADGARSVRPNIVVVMTDDQTYRSLGQMPTVQAELAREGTSYSRFFVNFALCCPSRATFLTGQYFHNHRVAGTYARLNDRKTLPVWLRRDGYKTGFVGKYLNKYGDDRPRYVPPGWNEWSAAYGASTQSVFGYELNEDGDLVHYGRQEDDFKQDVITELSRDFIRRRADGPPFFLHTSYTAPHLARRPRPFPPNCFGAAQPAPRHADLYDHRKLPRGPAFNERDVSDKPRRGPGAVGRLRRLTDHDIANITRKYRCALESLRSVDEGVGGILDELEGSGELDNTLIVFTSDNAFFFGEHRIPSQKNRPYEEAIRVPLIIRGPGVPSGRTSNRLSVNPDLTRTILDAANASPALRQDGESLLRPAGPRSAISIESGTFSGLRTGRYKYVVHETGDRELYDLRSDPYELRNRATAAGYRDERRRMARLLKDVRSCAGSQCR